jgi:precorrin-2/cobalt-factor-2 C20-methyltransferase
MIINRGENMTGTLFGVGVGPGDPELLTLKALRLIKESEVVAVPSSGGGESVALKITRQAVSLTGKELIELDMPMTKDKEVLRLAHNKEAVKIIEHLHKGTDVVFLTLGDPSIYSTYIYLHRIVKEKGYKAQIIPGVPSFCAASAKLGAGLVETWQPLNIIPASYGNLEECLELPGTKVLMKSGKAFNEVYAKLTELGMLDNAQMVENCGMENERICHSLQNVKSETGYFSIIIVKDKQR